MVLCSHRPYNRRAVDGAAYDVRVGAGKKTLSERTRYFLRRGFRRGKKKPVFLTNTVFRAYQRAGEYYFRIERRLIRVSRIYTPGSVTSETLRRGQSSERETLHETFFFNSK